MDILYLFETRKTLPYGPNGRKTLLTKITIKLISNKCFKWQVIICVLKITNDHICEFNIFFRHQRIQNFSSRLPSKVLKGSFPEFQPFLHLTYARIKRTNCNRYQVASILYNLFVLFSIGCFYRLSHERCNFNLTTENY